MRQRRGSKWMVAATVAVASLTLLPLAASAQILVSDRWAASRETPQ